MHSDVQILKETSACLEENDAITNDPWVQHNHKCEKSNVHDHEKKFGVENVQNYDETNNSMWKIQEMVTTKREKITKNLSNLQVVLSQKKAYNKKNNITKALMEPGLG